MTNVTSRPYQTQVKNEAYQAWSDGAKNVLIEMPTGAGKTVVVSDIFNDRPPGSASVSIAHRQELVSQLSLGLAQVGVYHNIIAPPSVVKFVSQCHTLEIGKSFFHPQSPTVVSGVKTLIRRDLGSWPHQVTLWSQDEAHHVLRENEWGKAAALFPNAYGLGVTATPVRADGKGLGRHSHGLFDELVRGPSMRDLINQGYLTDYRIFAPASDFDVSSVDVSKTTGDFNHHQLRQASKKSHIVGDVVTEYIKIATGKVGVCFSVDIDTATEIAQRFNALGVPAAVISSKTGNRERVELLSRLRRREILMLVNVDLFGEGFDLPAIEVVIMARPTQSYALYAQQFGRGLRILEGKAVAIIIDHVGNVIRHGLPDAPRTWSLDARERGVRGKRDESIIPVIACVECMSIYEKIYASCPYCGHHPEPEGRSRPDQVDGDLTELNADVLAMLRGEILTVNESPADLAKRLNEDTMLPPAAIRGQVNHRRAAIAARIPLVEAINLWRGHREEAGESESQSYRRFFHRFGMDVLSAQALNRTDSTEIMEKIKNDYVE
jgi:superfamily II DNA or RNA helicase